MRPTPGEVRPAIVVATFVTALLVVFAELASSGLHVLLSASKATGLFARVVTWRVKASGRE